nr:MAG TPA: hypothetical protein [Caudoviricetes sp.]
MEDVPSNSPTSGQGLFFFEKILKNFIKTIDIIQL